MGIVQMEVQNYVHDVAIDVPFQEFQQKLFDLHKIECIYIQGTTAVI